jgi:hypothetical protein
MKNCPTKSAKLFLLASFWMLTLAASAQTSADVMSNQSVVDMIKAGFSKELIISKIEASDCKFNMSTQALIDLKKQRVPEEVITAMLNKDAHAKTQAEPHKAGDKKPAREPEPVQLDILNLIHVWDKHSNTRSPLERTTAQMKTRSKALGYGGVNMVFEVPGEKSAVRIKDSLPFFIVNTGGPTPDGFVLYKLVSKKKYRQAISANYSPINGMKGSEGVFSVNIRALKNGIFELTPATPLTKGEYFFALRSAGNALTTSNAEVYAFGVD